FGKGNLIHLDYGKNAYTFVRRADGRAIRISGLPQRSGVPASGDTPGDGVPGDGVPGDGQERSPSSMQERSEAILAAPIEDLYEVRQVDAVVPPTARVFASLDCASCGEATMETRIRLLDGRRLCPPCFERAVAQD
ncbi:MAG TPA: TraR/DksA C4-type zinc finger protein, partial [Acidimicrobiales bacterium]|nr:TraR/DksA C4-type zinc finger protein [Acidimicrobiales bacterium]